MPYHEDLADRVRDALIGQDEITEKKMFGGLSFLYRKKMSVGIIENNLVVRVIDGKYEECLKRPHVSKMDFTGRVMKNFVYVAPDGYESDAQLTEWIEMGIEHAALKAAGK